MKLQFSQVLIIIIILLMLLGCSNEQAGTQPKDCLATVFQDHKAINIPVACSSPIEIMSILGREQHEVEQILGPPDLSLQKHEREFFYIEGGIKIVYTPKGLAAKIQIHPHQLPAKADDILSFLGLEDPGVNPYIFKGSFEWKLSGIHIGAKSYLNDSSKIMNIRIQVEDISDY